MSDPQVSTPHCEHLTEYGEGVEWPIVRALVDEGSRDGAHIRIRLQELIS